MKNLMALIKSGFDKKPYRSLIDNRSDYMLPFGARYRIIDFTLSNMSEHGLTKVLLHAGQNIRSTLDHVGNGKHWEMDKKRNGLVITVPNANYHDNANKRINSYYESLPFFNESEMENIYVANPMVVSRIDITEAYDEFIKNDYDAMFLYRKQEDPTGEFLNSRKIIFGEDGLVVEMGINLGTETVFNLFMDHVFIKKSVFNKVITEAREKNNAFTLSQAIINKKDSLKIGALEIKRHMEYVKDLQSFYNANMHLLNQGIYADLFLRGNGILTKNKDEPSTVYTPENKTTNSVVANGCIIEGEVSNSVLFRGVKVGQNAIVKNSILFQGVTIETGAIVVNAIVDKNGTIRKNVFVQGTQNNPYVVQKNKILEK